MKISGGLASLPMHKWLAIPILLVLACVIAGTYGALHSQISYSVSPEYFTVKFPRFEIPEGTPPRIGAAIVGWKAAWWMGIVIGFFLIPVGSFVLPRRGFVMRMVGVFGVVVATMLFAGLLALGLSYFLINAARLGPISGSDAEIAVNLAYHRAGAMHGGSYFGGLLGIVTGWLKIIGYDADFTDPDSAG